MKNKKLNWKPIAAVTVLALGAAKLFSNNSTGNSTSADYYAPTGQSQDTPKAGLTTEEAAERAQKLWRAMNDIGKPEGFEREQIREALN